MREIGNGEADGQLIARIREHDGDAMAALYDRYNRMVYTVALRVLHDTAAAEDLAHDVFLNVWRAPGNGLESASLGPWLAVVTRNRAIDVIRRRKFVVETNDDSPPPEPSVTPHLEQDQMAGRARAVIALMGADQRQALEMAYFDGLSHTEIAEKTGIPLGTIKTRIRAGIQALRKEFHC